jgi:hypothetical protein
MAESKRRYIIGVVKIPKRHRDRADRILGRDGQRGRWRDILNSATDDAPEVEEVTDEVAEPIKRTAAERKAAKRVEQVERRTRKRAKPGAPTATYTAELTEAEAAELAENGESSEVDNNVRYVEADEMVAPDVYTVPSATTLSWLNASLAQQGTFTGAGVKVAVLDGGTTAAMRAQMSWTMVAKKVIPPSVPSNTENILGHGCLVASEAVPPAGQLIDGMIASGAGGEAAHSDMAAGIIWACDQGAKVINLSFGGTVGGAPPQVLIDAANYALPFGAQITISAGNNSATDLTSTSSLARLFPNVHAIGAVDPATNQIASFSNRNADLAGVLPGVNQDGVDLNGNLVTWQGTSSSAPKAALLIAMLCTGGTYTPQKAAQALRSSARDLGLGVNVQGRGAWSLSHAITHLANAASNPGDKRVQVASNAEQWLTSGVYTRVKFGVTREADPRVTLNANRDVFTVNTAGRYIITASVRWIGHNTAPGDRWLALGNNIVWGNAGAKVWKHTAAKGVVDTPLGFNVAHTQKFAAGDQFCLWGWHSAGIPWALMPQVANTDDDVTNLTIDYLGA